MFFVFGCLVSFCYFMHFWLCTVKFACVWFIFFWDMFCLFQVSMPVIAVINCLNQIWCVMSVCLTIYFFCRIYSGYVRYILVVRNLLALKCIAVSSVPTVVPGFCFSNSLDVELSMFCFLCYWLEVIHWNLYIEYKFAYSFHIGERGFL